MIDKKETERRENRSDKEICRIYTIRFLILVIVVTMLGGAGYVIYYVSDKQAEVHTSHLHISAFNKIRLYASGCFYGVWVAKLSLELSLPAVTPYAVDQQVRKVSRDRPVCCYSPCS